MKNVFKILGFIAILAVVGFGFTACGGDDDNGDGGGCSHTFTDAVCTKCSIGTGLVQIDAGSLTWESVTITLSEFKMGKYQVTQEFYEAIMGENPSLFQGSENLPAEGETQGKRPVEYVTWFDAIEFCNKLSEKESLTPVYTITGRTPATGYPITAAILTANWEANGYRLPTEAQWEYAWRAGSTADYSMGASNTQITTENLANYAWYKANSGNITHEVGKKTANAYGLFDMHGNVWELCWDWYGTLPTSNQTDYTGAVSGTSRVLRGGGWSNSADGLVSVDRNWDKPNGRSNALGFRIARP